ncbi:MAG: DNA polymerase III subunit alpha, partial [Verrucomicrobia bacterium]|nr:DNA polymerase III subunit alpha [Verrucomicrobiota bacterium]
RDTNNIPQAKANEIFDLLEKFAGYGFNKSHAAAYALVAYQTAYLKTNYPIEFLSAMLTNDMDDTDKLATLINEAKSLGINVLGPDVNESQADFAPTPDKRSIRFGLLAIKGLGATAAETIVNARNIGGPFESLTEFCERVDTRAVNRRVMEVLIKSGACDGFNMNRASMYSQIDAALARGAGAAQDRQSGQASLFSLMEEEEISAPPLHADLPEWPLNELLTAEKELLGFYVTGHPLNPYMGLIKTYSMTDSSAIRSLPDRTTTRIGGLLESVQHGQSKKTGKPYAFAELEDIHGEIQVLFLNNNLETYQHLLTPGNVVLVSGEINNTEETTKMFASEIMRLTDAPAKLAKHAQIRFHKTKPTKQLLEQVKDLVSQHKGNCPLFLCVKHESGAFVFIEAHEQYRVCPSLELHNQIENLLGKNSFFVKIDETLPQKTARRWENKGKTT